MVIKEFNSLNTELVREIEKLTETCGKFDGIQEEVNLDDGFNFNKSMKWLFVLYEKDKVVSVVSIFAPKEEEGEISACTLPEYRRKGYFKELLSKAKNELLKYNVPKILFVCPKGSKQGEAVIKNSDAIYKFAEYTMNFNKNKFKAKGKYITKLAEANYNDLNKITKVASDVYSESYEQANSMMKNALESSDRLQFKLKLKEDYIGVVAAYFYHDKVSIFGVGILPEYRGRGFGREMMSMLLEYLIERDYDDIALEVDSNNKRAFELYKSIGFQIEREIDYYEEKINNTFYSY
ncbi:GNAT family N-acetyltransferase [Clostridium acetobutylicum]|uniref:Acetyltransferase (With duplicated domains), possibly RIMI-like protein n=1 Tax=Clostridium acetobutylicum (strain ATCC 824 / DSM 792 / JCM 1419 / IAM 19013 / LMG 5710 / NBRC 13948 / NRRL B-527 / VKM B-1787 / 2291 / W) TaxID=272562 RepID=Q97D33_CLOAB|nr:Acetyltransferase (with duplicated domains), possibly RIMI-like protein [Clostridium acetobutylicum ATCC 824]AEI32971.1 acetyltransferase [Clostridium acetobutylicum DSM 1731]AWV80756.1 GNAT family N-acetyltransferase [Clostridium acetobutylicum]PSM05345.1 GNAT family N-acetyltransferase [Clostridium sp. NJ4]MBC2393919.1 GNAT family N-acetyltransferase [Clostridium acetobutylicum]